MNISDFKAKHGLDAINFRKKTQAGRLVSYDIAQEVGQNEDGTKILSGLIITAEGFDPSKPAFVYADSEKDCHWVTNTEQKAPLLAL